MSQFLCPYTEKWREIKFQLILSSCVPSQEQQDKSGCWKWNAHPLRWPRARPLTPRYSSRAAAQTGLVLGSFKLWMCLLKDVLEKKTVWKLKFNLIQKWIYFRFCFLFFTFYAGGCVKYLNIFYLNWITTKKNPLSAVRCDQNVRLCSEVGCEF